MSLITEVRTLLDEANGGVFFLDQQVYDALNEAQLEMLTGDKVRLETATLTVGVGDSTVSIPTNIMVPKWIEDNTKKYYPTTHTKLEQYSRSWRKHAPAKPEFFILRDFRALDIWPVSNGTYTYTMFGTDWGTEINASNSDLDHDPSEPLRQSIVYRAAAGLMELTQPQWSAIMMKEAEDYASRHARQLRNSFSHNTTTLRPGNKASSANSGIIKFGRGL